VHKTLLAVGAHYDDCVFGVPGILLQAVRKDYRVVILSLIGDYSRWRPVGPRRSQALLDGTTAISKEYGVEMRYLDYASMGFALDDDSKRRVSEAVADVRPDLALMLWPNDTHPDHEAASALSKTALRWAGTVLAGTELASQAKRPSRIYQFDNGPRHTRGFEPDTYVDVSAEWKPAVAWLGRFMALVRNEPYDLQKPSSAEDAKTALARYRGEACGVEYAEALKSFEPYPQEIL